MPCNLSQSVRHQWSGAEWTLQHSGDDDEEVSRTLKQKVIVADVDCSAQASPQLAVEPLHYSDNRQPEDQQGDDANAEGDDANAHDENDVKLSETQKAQAIVKQFTEDFQQGMELTVITTERPACPCIVTLDRKVETVTIAEAGQVDAEPRTISMEHIVEVIVGFDHSAKIRFTTDQYCVSVVLNDKRAVGFVIPQRDHRDIFAVCLSTFVDVCREKREQRRRHSETAVQNIPPSEKPFRDQTKFY